MANVFVELQSFGALEAALGYRPDAARRAAEYVRQHAKRPGAVEPEAERPDLPACPMMFGIACMQE